MTKAQLNIVENDETENENTEVSENNIVTLSTGEVLNFRKMKVISSYDVPTLSISFKVVTGEVITLSVDELPENIKNEALLYGLREKIKAKASAEKIVEEITHLKEGKFVTRSSDAGEVGLDNFMKAFAFINATASVDTGNGTFEVPASMLAVPELHPSWKDVNDFKVIDEVITFWNSLSRAEKSNQKRNPFIKTQVSFIESGIVSL